MVPDTADTPPLETRTQAAPADPTAGWGLLDAEAQHEAHPDAFPIPSGEERAAVRPGDLVKLVFVLDPPPDDGPNAERMWVEVRNADAGAADGWLTNEPVVIGQLKAGTLIAFDRRHVAGIALREDEVGFDLSLQAVISNRVLEADGPPGWAGFDLPLDIEDSGWTITTGHEGDDFFSADPTEVTQVMTLGELVQRYPSLVEVFQAGEGEWVYRPDHRRFVRVKGS